MTPGMVRRFNATAKVKTSKASDGSAVLTEAGVAVSTAAVTVTVT